MGFVDRPRNPPWCTVCSILGEWILSCQHLIHKKTFRTYLHSFIVEDPSWIVEQHAARVPGLLPSLALLLPSDDVKDVGGMPGSSSWGTGLVLWAESGAYTHCEGFQGTSSKGSRPLQPQEKPGVNEDKQLGFWVQRGQMIPFLPVLIS